MEEWKAYLTVTNITLVVACITLLFTILSYRLSRKNRKDNIKNSLMEKQAELDSINEYYFNSMTTYMGFPEKNQMNVRKMVLEKEIKELKKQL